MTAAPSIVDENFIFNSEGGSAAGWTVSNASLAPTSNSVLFTKTLASDSFISKPLPPLPAKRDFIFYGKVKAKNAAGCANVVWMRNATASQQIALWLGSDGNQSQNSVPGSIGLAASAAGVVQNALLASGFDYQANWFEFAILYDSTFSTATAFIRDANGFWSFGGRVPAEFMSPPVIYVQSSGSSPVGNFVEVEYLSICKPNFLVIGDSVAAGATQFNPNPSFGLTNYMSTWMKHVNLYPGLRNNLIVNKGVAGNTSQMILSRIADASNHGARVVFLQGSSNDEGASVSFDARTAAVQASIAFIVASGAKVVVISGLDGTQASSLNSAPRNLKGYMQAWWMFYRDALRGVECFIDIAEALRLPDGYQDPALTQPDGIHLNIDGFKVAAGRISQVLGA